MPSHPHEHHHCCFHLQIKTFWRAWNRSWVSLDWFFLKCPLKAEDHVLQRTHLVTRSTDNFSIHFVYYSRQSTLFYHNKQDLRKAKCQRSISHFICLWWIRRLLLLSFLEPPGQWALKFSVCISKEKRKFWRI